MESRVSGWEGRLAAVLKDAARRPFDARHWNCARFAHACAEAVAGRALPAVWKGSLEESADAVLPRIRPAFARRGDIVLAAVPAPSLGVCLGARAAFVAKDGGLLTRPMGEVSLAWAV